MKVERRVGILCLGWIGLVATATAAEPLTRTFITPDGKPPSGLFASGVRFGNTLYIAGKGDYRPNAPFAEKVDNCLAEVRKTLTAAGLDTQHIVQSFVYLEDPDQYPLFNERYAQVFSTRPPARTTLGVAQVPGESRVEITCVAYADAAQIRPVGSPPPGLPFSPGIVAGETLYVSGKGDQRADGTHPPTYPEQVTQALANVEATLTAAGLDLRHVVFTQIFLDRTADRATTEAVYATRMSEVAKDQEPALAVVPVDWIPGGSHVEITCLAVTDLGRRTAVRPAALTTVPRGASAGVWAGDTLYLSGLSGLDTPEAPADLDIQTQTMARHHAAVLEAVGLSFDDLVSGCVYLHDMADYQPMNAIYRQFYSRGHGVRTCLMPAAAATTAAGPRVWGSFIAVRSH